MKTFPANFAAQKDKVDGAAPVWIFKFRAGGVDRYLSDAAVAITPWGVTTLPWITSWGRLTEGVSGQIEEFKISDTTITCTARPEVTPNIVQLALQYNLEADLCYLYQWYVGCTDAPQEFFRGYIREYPLSEGDTVCALQIQDETLKWENIYVGNKVTTQQYPGADPDDVGKVIPIPFGTVPKLVALAVNAGAMTSLPATIGATATSFAVSSGTALAPGMSVQIDDEEILIGAVSGDTITSCTRGYNGTMAAAHQKAAIVWEMQSSFDYIVSDFPVTAISKVYGRVGQAELDITSVCTRYPTGNHPAYPGKAVITIPGFITAAQAVSLLPLDTTAITDNISVYDTISVDQGNHTHPTSTSTTQVTLDTAYSQSGLGWNYPSNLPAQAIDGNYSTYMRTDGYGGRVNFRRATTVSGSGTPLAVRLAVNWSGSSNATGIFDIYINGANVGQFVASGASGQITQFSGWFNISAWTDLYAAGNTYVAANINGSIFVYEMWWEVQTGTANTYSPATGVGKLGGAGRTAPMTNMPKSGTITLTGNSVANTLIADMIMADVVSPLTDPDDVIGYILSTWCGVATLQVVGTMPGGYVFNGAITEYRRAMDWIHDLAWQCRCWFRHSLGKGQLIVRTLNPAPVKTIDACATKEGKRQHSRDKTPFGEVINSIKALFGRDWTKAKSAAAYTGVSSGTDQASIGVFGLSERPELFQWDFVTSQAMADDLVAFCIAWYAWRHWLHTFTADYRQSELEFADAVALGFAGSVTGQVVTAGFDPGEDAIEMKVIE